MENNSTITHSGCEILKGKPTEKDLEIINEMVLKGYTYGLNIPKGIEWQRE